MDKQAQFDVVIIGAGIAGSALALALAGQGMSLALIEAQVLPEIVDPQADPGVNGFDPRVSALTPRSQALLEKLEVWPGVAQQRLCPYQHMRVWDADGTAELAFDCAEVEAPVLGHIVENRVIVSSLAQQLRQCSDITLFNPRKVERCERREDELVVGLAGGEIITAPLLVAADGALSRVRDMFEFQTREWDYGHRAIVTTVETQRTHDNTAWQRFLPTGPLAFLPLPDMEGRHYCSIVWSVEEALVDELLALDDAAFCARLGTAFENRLGEVRGCARRFAFPLRQRHAVDYVQPGLALVGDAAHTIHPLAGQGINLGLQDVAALAQELTQAWARGVAPGRIETLRRYQRRRKGENLLMMAAMDGFKRLFEQRSLPLRWLRNAGMRGVGRLAPLKQQIMLHAMGVER